MYSLDHLKSQLELSPNKVSGPVVGCNHFVDRQQRVFRTDARFTCHQHRIPIGPSTFQYCAPENNLLWGTPEERALLEVIKGTKREDRMARERSEDALTWNVFRSLEAMGHLGLGMCPPATGSTTGHAIRLRARPGRPWPPRVRSSERQSRALRSDASA
jgi:hypothetical protein